MIKKHLIFSFFIPNDYETNIAIRMHYACLYRYCNVFDSAEFFITATDESKKYVDSVKISLLNIFRCKDIRFKEVDNDSFNESRTLKDNVIDKLDSFSETMIFFGHTKGTSDVVRYKGNESQFLKWIFGCYFYSLEFVVEAERKLFTIFHGRHHTFFGSFPMLTENGRCFLSGNFYWINPMALSKDIKTGEIEIPNMWDRGYAEDIPTLYKRGIVNDSVVCKTGGHNCVETRWGEIYFYETNFDDIVRIYGDYELFMNRYNELLKDIMYD